MALLAIVAGERLNQRPVHSLQTQQLAQNYLKLKIQEQAFKKPPPPEDLDQYTLAKEIAAAEEAAAKAAAEAGKTKYAVPKVDIRPPPNYTEAEQWTANMPEHILDNLYGMEGKKKLEANARIVKMDEMMEDEAEAKKQKDVDEMRQWRRSRKMKLNLKT